MGHDQQGEGCGHTGALAGQHAGLKEPSRPARLTFTGERSTARQPRVKTMPIRWDNIQILQAIDRRQQQHGGGPVQGMSGLHLMEEVAGSQVTDPPLWRGFVQELHIARRIGLLTFTETYKGNPNADPGRNPHFYLQTIWDFALTVPGQDRARGRVVVQPPSDPAEDNGNLISDLILQQIAEAIDHQYSEGQAVTFLMEAGALILDLPQFLMRRVTQSRCYVH
jgi:hypothetical protein